ncbi:MAG: nuclear transport factor 2 family protein [Myxococcales bacterium]|nr:nuclear transport factor 2 family protein [Myxococcales bacterium]
MRNIRIPLIFSLLTALFAGLYLLLPSCSVEDSTPKNDVEKLALAEQMVDRYLAGWTARDVDALLELYGEGATIILPGRGSFSPTDFRAYLENLFAALDTLDTKETGREVLLTSSNSATAKFRHWLLTVDKSGAVFAEKTWVKLQMSYSYSKNWRIVYQNGEDQIVLNDQLGTMFSLWVNAWRSRSVDGILVVYAPQATIVEADGETLTLDDYRARLAELFAGLQSAQVNYYDYTLKNMDWETARLAFRLSNFYTDLEGGTATVSTDYTWDLSIKDDDTGWLVTAQTAANESSTDDDDDDDDDNDDNDTTPGDDDDDDDDDNDDNDDNDTSPDTV